MLHTITARNRPLSKGRIFYYEPPTHTLTGSIIPNASHITSDHITLLDPKTHTIHTIHKGDILTGYDTQGFTPRNMPASTIHKVTGSTGNLYTVTQTNDIWTCECKGFQYRKDCAHIRRLKELNNLHQ